MFEALRETDPEVFEQIQNETKRQDRGLEMIASENYVSRAVLEAQGSILTNKYAEGIPGKRYYGGCEYVDVIERLARRRAVKLFSADYANVQSHSGAQANAAAYQCLIKPGDTVLGMDLRHGGHLTHGSPLNFSGQLYNFIPYGVSEKTGRVDMDIVAALTREHKPKLVLAGFSAYPRELDFARFKEIADEVGAKFMVDMAHVAGLVATGLYPSPVPYADVVTTTTHKTLRGPRAGLILCKDELKKVINRAVFPGQQGGPLCHVISAKAVAFKEALRPEFKEYSKKVVENARALAETMMKLGYKLISDGTDNHMILVDLRNKNMTGKFAEDSLQKVYITINKNLVPNDPEKPHVSSGARIGTPALTTRGFGADEMHRIAKLIDETLMHADDEKTLERVRGEVLEMCDRHPIYHELLVTD